ncbi:hypothetical protein HMPREF0201_00571 [Cedecea davisae DSM 4568]|uniref:Uncharacterized protein n=1 Tax=Cedecea davisae DSM 4568 TaxID=566551 RepID=S3J845_9ENTR|nr:hypothetical protein HMPREF0201_00571 [Cedecea davisae DSM 4568]
MNKKKPFVKKGEGKSGIVQPLSRQFYCMNMSFFRRCFRLRLKNISFHKR